MGTSVMETKKHISILSANPRTLPAPFLPLLAIWGDHADFPSVSFGTRDPVGKGQGGFSDLKCLRTPGGPGTPAPALPAPAPRVSDAAGLGRGWD